MRIQKLKKKKKPTFGRKEHLNNKRTETQVCIINTNVGYNFFNLTLICLTGVNNHFESDYIVI